MTRNRQHGYGTLRSRQYSAGGGMGATRRREFGSAAEFESLLLSHQDLLGLQRLTHEQIRDRLKANPPTGFRALARVDAERIGGDPLDEATDILRAEGFDVTDDNVARFVPLLAQAKVGAIRAVGTPRSKDRRAAGSSVPARLLDISFNTESNYSSPSAVLIGLVIRRASPTVRLS